MTDDRMNERREHRQANRRKGETRTDERRRRGEKKREKFFPFHVVCRTRQTLADGVSACDNYTHTLVSLLCTRSLHRLGLKHEDARSNRWKSRNSPVFICSFYSPGSVDSARREHFAYHSLGFSSAEIEGT